MTTDATRIMHNRYIKDDPERRASLASIRLHTDIALMVRRARKDAGLSQQQLAEMIGSSQSVISRIENINYEGHSMGLLTRIASGLGLVLHVNIIGGEK